MSHSIELQYAHYAPEVWEALGKIERTGWVMRGVTNPETVQEHTLALIDIAITLPELTEYRNDRLCDILEVHDWPEALVGDEVVLEWDSAKKKARKADKHKREREAMQKICDPLQEAGERIYALWLRYEEGTDETARLAKEIDKYQSVARALTYEISQNKTGLFKEFRDYLLEVFTHPTILTQLRQLEERADKDNIPY